MRRLALRVALLLASTLVFLAAAEVLYRSVAPPPASGVLYYADARYREIDLTTPAGLLRAQEQMEVVPDAPRFRMNFRPGADVRLCYRGYEGRDGFDEHGCVPFRYSSCGIREREELCLPKASGERRILCIGDSTTVGWGVRVEDAWPRRVEVLLRPADDALRTVNCGASGAIAPDEYVIALRSRFARFDPDLVVVTLCINDLLPVNGGMAHFDPAARAAMSHPLGGVPGCSRLLSDFYRMARIRDALHLDPAHDWVAELLALPPDQRPDDAKAMGAVYWSDGVPQRSLLEIQSWCRERNVPFAVMLWPFLQGLESRAEHPFAGMHDRVAAFCTEHGIPFLDLLDVFLGRDPAQLWVTPKDLHGNAEAHALAAPVIARFVAPLVR
ncbi:MAG: SGNH/GDSL hydrolase family protein [Planctomycetes bacterium]|nr:SGNH/GDSL hydrolase family protein [Planctomycetota bacterium]